MRATPGLRCLLAALVLASALTAQPAGARLPGGLIAFDRAPTAADASTSSPPTAAAIASSHRPRLRGADVVARWLDPRLPVGQRRVGQRALLVPMATGTTRRLTHHSGSTHTRPGRRTARRSPGPRIAAGLRDLGDAQRRHGRAQAHGWSADSHPAWSPDGRASRSCRALGLAGGRRADGRGRRRLAGVTPSTPPRLRPGRPRPLARHRGRRRRSLRVVERTSASTAHARPARDDRVASVVVPTVARSRSSTCDR